MGRLGLCGWARWGGRGWGRVGVCNKCNLK